MGMFSVDEQPRFIELEREVKRLEAENNTLRQELQELGIAFDALRAKWQQLQSEYHCNLEDSYYFNNYNTLLDEVWDRR